MCVSRDKTVGFGAYELWIFLFVVTRK